ncbi:hypothetical protein C8N36_10280 [Pelagimonas varians]|uniref:Uncharacterized protein n=1 Tax=Pelagimonas varians TaxID=696760 RepID=A0A238JY95_9RHOB|nr:hypothetical protein C8N36_10280 [Pelagimonas varians]SMX35638.1 hypothetical protein PEV8663_00542 [Pelagimonas varians]
MGDSGNRLWRDVAGKVGRSIIFFPSMTFHPNLSVARTSVMGRIPQTFPAGGWTGSIA